MRRICVSIALAVAVTVTGADEEHDAFVARANGICERHAEQFAQVEQSRSIEQLFKRVEQVTKITRSQIAELEKIAPAPADDEQEFEALLVAMRETLAGYGDFQQALLRSQPTVGDAALERIEAADSRVRERADALGLDACVTQPS